MVIFILVFSSMIHDYFRPYRYRPHHVGADLWNRIEHFSLQIMILTLVGGLAMNSTQNMLLPLLQNSNSTSTWVKQEITLYEFELDFVSYINLTFMGLLAAAYLYYTFKYAPIDSGSGLAASGRERGKAQGASIEDGSIQLSEVINPIVFSDLAVKGVSNPLLKAGLKRSKGK